MGQQLVRRVLLHGKLPRRADDARRAERRAAPDDGPDGCLHAPPATRSGKVMLRIYGLLGVLDVVAISRDLVRQSSGRDVLHLLSALRGVAADWHCSLSPRLSDSVHRIARCPTQ